MALRLQNSDFDLLASTAEYRTLTIEQLAFLHGRNPRATGRRVRALEKAGLIRAKTSGLGRGPGRPAKLVYLTNEGLDLLHDNGRLPRDVAHDRITVGKIDHLEHQLLLNSFRVHLVHLERVLPRLSIQFLSPTSTFPHGTRDDLLAIGHGGPKTPRSDVTSSFIPDGVFSIADAEEGKTLLFFLEVDMGTETLVSTGGAGANIRQKIGLYQTYFRNLAYKRYQETWNCSLNGFRLLFLTNSDRRLANLCRLVVDTPSSDFIWLTDEARMAKQGLSGKIWARGGKLEPEPESILGPEMAMASPVPAGSL